MTRPLLEHQLRARLARHDNVIIEQGVQVSGLAGSAWKITGVQVVAAEGGTRGIEAELVVDASGRGATLPGWLAQFGLPAPEQDEVQMELTYTSCLVRRKSHHLAGELGFVCTPSAPVRRGGAAVAVEGERYLVTLMGYLGERAPRTFAGMVEYARSLPVPDLYELLRDAEPVSEPVQLRDPKSVRPRYERLKHWPEGVLPMGDALCRINPSHGHGMTLAALEAQALSRALDLGVRGAAARFFREVTPLIDVPWSLVSGADFEFEGVEGNAERPPAAVRSYFKRALRVASVEREVALAVYRVMHLIEPPSLLFSPPIVRVVLASDPELAASMMIVPDGEGVR
jgi:2-polyprenyl-6-methoxyphenol hydroxylase-like FAD-dependent oxidoreductase